MPSTPSKKKEAENTATLEKQYYLLTLFIIGKTFKNNRLKIYDALVDLKFHKLHITM